jgi:hypothetical protein
MGWVVSVTPRPRCTPGERTPCTHCTGGWVDPRAGLYTEDRGKILCPRRGSNPDRPVVQPIVRHYTAWATPAPKGYGVTKRIAVVLYALSVPRAETGHADGSGFNPSGRTSYPRTGPYSLMLNLHLFKGRRSWDEINEDEQHDMCLERCPRVAQPVSCHFMKQLTDDPRSSWQWFTMCYIVIAATSPHMRRYLESNKLHSRNHEWTGCCNYFKCLIYNYNLILK